MNNFLHDTSAIKTKIAFTPILSFFAIEYDPVHTIKCNFQDNLIQKSQSYGPLLPCRCVPVGKRTPAFGSCTLWQHNSGFRGFSYGESYDSMLWKILVRYRNQFNFYQKQNFCSRKCLACHQWGSLRSWNTWNSNSFRSFIQPTS